MPNTYGKRPVSGYAPPQPDPVPDPKPPPQQKMALLFIFGMLCVFFFGQMGLTYEAVKMVTKTKINGDGVEVLKTTNEAVHTQDLEQRVRITVRDLPAGTEEVPDTYPGAERAEIGTISRNAFKRAVDNAKLASSKGMAQYIRGDVSSMVNYDVRNMANSEDEVEVMANGRQYVASCKGVSDECVIFTFVVSTSATGRERALSAVSQQALLERALRSRHFASTASEADVLQFERSLKKKAPLSPEQLALEEMQLALEEKVYDKENLIEWVPNSSMELNGKPWEFTVPLLNGPQVRNSYDPGVNPGPGCSSGATYSCRLSKSKNVAHSYVIDCDKSGGNGKGDTLYFRDSEGGKDGTYSLCMKKNNNHVVRFNSKNPNIVSVGYTLCGSGAVLTLVVE